MITVDAIRTVIHSHFPPKAAEDWDNTGLLAGRGDAQVSRVLVALELTQDVMWEAEVYGAQLILTHHPFIFKPLKNVTSDSPEGAMLLALLESRTALLASHTNLDASPSSINEKLADDLGLTARRILLKHTPFSAYKIVVFVPEAAEAAVASAMHAAGAGCVGGYSDVSFRGSGTGCFRCGEDTRPAIGTPGSVERVPEKRIEMVVSSHQLGRVTQAMLAAHPYEVPAYDVFKLESDVRGMTDQYGFGMIGTLPEAVTLRALIDHIKQLWSIDGVRACGEPEKMIRRVAIMNGAGAKFQTLCGKDVDAYITGDCGHHDFDQANRRGLALIDAGHYDTEKYIPYLLKDVLEKAFGNALELKVAETMRRPFDHY